jgi:hypothetical protein
MMEDDPRACVAAALADFPPDKAALDAFEKTLARTPQKAILKDPSALGVNARVMLVASMAGFFEPRLVALVAAAVRSAKGDFRDEVIPVAIPVAAKLMMPDDRASVAALAPKGLEKDIVDVASKALDQCKKNLGCWLAILDEPPAKTPAERMRAVKAAWMAGMLGTDATRVELAAKLTKSGDTTTRIAILRAIDHLAPAGDPAVAKALEDIVAAKADVAIVDEASRVALRLRARAPRP